MVVAVAHKCPECGSERLYRDGLRYLSTGETVQRWLCRGCGYRFSEPSKRLNSVSDNRGTVQVCVLKAKNLTEALENKTSAGEEKSAGSDIKGVIAQYTAKLITLGLSNSTINRNLKSIRMLQDQGADIFNPELTFKTIMMARKFLEPKREKRLSEEPWSSGTKSVVAKAYLNFCKLTKISIPEYVNFHAFKQNSKIPWIPLEQDIDILIHACSRKVSVFLQVLKESGARSGEIVKLKWKDVDFERKFISINEPEKGSLPRQFKISSKLATMLDTLPRQGPKVWGKSTLHQIRSNFNNQRNRTAFKLGNPRLREIHFHSFRHWFASTEYHKLKDILRVKQKLGHKSINNTMIYTHLIECEVEEYTSKIAKNIKEAEELVNAGFEYVCDYNEEGKLFRKRK